LLFVQWSALHCVVHPDTPRPGSRFPEYGR
jgi:hypothetical protein